MAGVAFRCTTCNNDLLAPMDGEESTLQTHREIPHLKCEVCNKFYTPRRRQDHELMYHSHKCDICSKTFTQAANLSRHKTMVHRRYQCPFCPVSSMREFHNGPAALQAHVERSHHGKAAHHCDDCNSVYSSEANYKRHVAIVHKKQCVYCDEVDGRHPRFTNTAQLRQHMATTHNQHVCHFCGDMFTFGEGLYRHQTEHCQRRYVCVSCDRDFPTLRQCQAHMSSHVSRIGACSPYDTPSQRQHTMLWHTLLYRHKPWHQDVTTIIGAGHLQDRINTHYHQLRGGVAPRQQRLEPAEEENLRLRAYENVRTHYQDRLREFYANNLRQYVNHTTTKDGRIERFNINLLGRRGFLSQVESALRLVFDACRYQIPYRITIAFGFVLYKMQTDQFEQFFVVDHLARNPNDRVLINQIPNVWIIRCEADEDSVITDIQQTDFFDLLRDQSDAEQYNFLIVRMTNMVVQVFPVLDCDIHDNVFGNRQYIGRGADDSDDDDDDDDDGEEEDEEEEEEEEESTPRRRNPYILDEVSEDDDDDDETDEEEEDRPGGGGGGGGRRTKDERIKKYVQVRSGRNGALVSLKRTMTQRHGRAGAVALYKKLCFFAQVARWRLVSESARGEEVDATTIRQTALDYYSTYKYHFNIQSDDMFEGVHVSIVNFMEYMFKMRINVYEIHSLKKRTHQDRIIHSRESFADKYQPVLQPLYLSSGGHVYKLKTLNLLLHDGHYYTIKDMNKLMALHYRCISCGQIFKGRRMSVLKKHIQNRCGKIRYRYRRGAVQPHTNMWEEAKTLFSIPDDMLSSDDEDMLYTGHYATYDFEAILHKENVSEVEFSSSSEVLVYDEHGEPCTEQDYMDNHEEEAYIIINRPLSYAVACNVYDTEEAREDYEFMELMVPSDERSDCGVSYAAREDPEDLIKQFVRTLQAIARVRRNIMLRKYEDIIEHITRWFSEKYIRVDLTRSCKDSSELLAEIDHTLIEELAEEFARDDTAQAMVIKHNTETAERNIEICSKEIRLLGKLKKFINHLPILGFNSSGYDIPLIKNYFLPELTRLVPSEASIQFVKKTTRYVSLTVNGLMDGGGFVFLYIMQYLAPGFNLDTFIKSFAGETSSHKSYFPYEYMDSYDKLTETQMPPYEAFVSELRQENQLDSEYQTYLVQKLGVARDTKKDSLSPEQLANAPQTGEEKYRMLVDMWRENHWQTIGDYLKYYNVQDVVPFLIGVCNYAKEMRSKQVDVVRDAISLPGLAKQILMKHVPHRSLYYIDDPSVYSTIKRNEVGGQSIIFTRKNGPEHPYVKGFDANSLYLYCLGEGQFTGKPVIYDALNDFMMSRRPMRRFPGYKHVTSKDSSAAEECLDYIDEVHLLPRNIHMQRQYRLALTVSEKKWISNKYDEHKIPKFSLFSNICVDGYYTVVVTEEGSSDGDVDYATLLDKRVWHVVEFDGCYWHACEVCGAGREYYGSCRTRRGFISRDKKQIIGRLRYEILERRGYVIHRIRECEWTSMRRQYRTIDEFCKSRSRRVDPLVFDKQRSSLTTVPHLLRMLVEKKVFGILVCDIVIPKDEDEERMKKYFEDFAPIIKHANINYDDIGEFMQGVSDRSGIKVKDRRCVIDSYFGKGVGLIDEYVVWLLNKGFMVDKVYTFIRYNKEPIFREFANAITEMRIKGDRDKHSEMPALMAKLIGNSAFGSTITNKDKHREVVLQRYATTEKTGGGGSPLAGSDYRAVVASLLNFIKYEQISPQLLEVERRHDKIVYDQLRYIAKTIFDRAKLSVLKFYYDFLKVVLMPDCFCLLETDTDSIYIATKYEKFEDNIDPEKRDLYEKLKSDYFITDECEYGKRQPNRYKVECEGHMMLSLCSKSYCVYDEGTKRVKYSAKGVQKANFNACHDLEKSQRQTFGETVVNLFQTALESATRDTGVSTTGRAVNRGLKRKYETMVMFEQEKVMFNNFYCKRRVLNDGIHTVPLSI